ncbi:MAG: FG-GAP repeat protein [Myxococcales bacterium]|nr:FG-GAP repeat protein [Myxococcales bacterium]
MVTRVPLVVGLAAMWGGCVSSAELATPAGPVSRTEGETTWLRGRWPGAGEMGLTLATPGVTEWWDTGPRGLEQGFVVDALPEAGPLLTVALELRGATATVDEDGRSATFSIASGGRLRYEGLRAWDALGRELPAWMEVGDDALILLVDTDGAVPPITIDPVLPTPSWTANGGANAHFGSAVSAGDVNGDGYDDLLVGARYHDRGSGDEGAAFVWYGSASGLPAGSSWSVYAGQTPPGNGPRLGWAGTARADVNGDGYDDVIVSAPTWVQGSQVGAVFVYQGAPGGLPANATTTLLGGTVNGWFGRSLASAGDVNGDGYDDLLVADNTTTSLHLGSAGGLSANAAWTVTGTVVASAGDVNGDGWLDVAVGRPSGFGSVDVYAGSAGGFGASPTTTITGTVSGGELGTAIAAADVDGDGYDDLVIGAPGPDWEGGHVHVHLGSAAGLASTAAWSLAGDEGNDQMGASLASAGDADGDGYEDVLVGVEGQGTGGAARFLLGSSTGELRPAWVAEETQGIAHLGAAVATGDVDGDGLVDLLVTDPFYDTSSSDSGRAHVWLGTQVDLTDPDGDGVIGMLDDCPLAADPLQVDLDDDGLGDACDAPLLEVGTPAARGMTTTLTATGVLPGEDVRFHAAIGAGGAGPCFQALGGLCLDLGAGAVALGRATADANGEVRLEVTVPLVVQPNGTYAVQAVVLRGADALASEVRVLDGADLDWDDDGMTDADELATGTDPTNPDTDGDGLLDGAEAPFYDPLLADTDGDGAPDGVDLCWVGDDSGPDGDGDGMADLCDVCPSVADPGQEDADRDGLGDACDGDVLVGPVEILRTGSDHWSGFGKALASGDVNGDGYSDVLVGRPGTLNEMGGRALLYIGSPTGLTTPPAWNHGGPWPGEAGYGSGVAVTDVDGDGYDDVVVGESQGWGYDIHRPMLWVYFGSPAGVSSVADWSYQGWNSEFGTWVAAAGDVDGDGYQDVLAGDGWNRIDLFLGEPGGLGTAAAWSSSSSTGGSAGDLNGDGYDDLWVAMDDWLGNTHTEVYLGGPAGVGAQIWSTTVAGPRGAAGDVNGDGYDDLVAGGSLLYGGSTGIAPAPGQQGDFRTAVALAGDVNGDGYDDLVVGDEDWRNGERGEGGAFLLLGSPTGYGAPAWQDESDQAGYTESDYYNGSWYQIIGYGSVVSSAGDVDGDGYDDVVIGAPWYGNDNGGSALVYHGQQP